MWHGLSGGMRELAWKDEAANAFDRALIWCFQRPSASLCAKRCAIASVARAVRYVPREREQQAAGLRQVSGRRA